MPRRIQPNEPTLQLRLRRLHKIDTSKLTERVRPRLKPRGLPPALEQHLVWGTAEAREAQQFGSDILGRHLLTVTDERPGDFYGSLHAVKLRDITLGYLDYTCGVRVEAPKLPTAFLVLVPMSGQSTVETRLPNGTVPTTVVATPITAAVPRPGHRLVIECQRQAPHLLVRIEQQALLLHLGRIMGRPPDQRLAFDLAFDLSAPIASRWNFAIQMLHAELFEPGSLLDRGVGTGQLEEFVMSSLLYAHQSNYSRFLGRPGQGGENRAIRAAKSYIEQHLAEPLTIGDIAAAAGVSERTLQAAFQSDLSITPMAYLRGRRLDRTRAELADAAARDRTSVTEVAERWGFGHLGRFAAEYKARFGESPSQTLRG
jgi:AraC-like DNA-binding protein